MKKQLYKFAAALTASLSVLSAMSIHSGAENYHATCSRGIFASGCTNHFWWNTDYNNNIRGSHAEQEPYGIGVNTAGKTRIYEGALEHDWVVLSGPKFGATISGITIGWVKVYVDEMDLYNSGYSCVYWGN